ncbi:hypothetical protein ACWC09_41455 [Streptomyces sp. NPDC001617]
MSARVEFWATPKPAPKRAVPVRTAAGLPVAASAARRTALVASLAQHAPAVRLSGLAAGFHAVAHLPSGADEEAVVTGARHRGVGLYGMSACRTSGATAPPQLVLGFGNVTERAITEGVAAVADLLDGEQGAAVGEEG